MSDGRTLMNSSEFYSTEIASYYVRWKMIYAIATYYVLWKRPFISNNEQLSSSLRQLLHSCI